MDSVNKKENFRDFQFYFICLNEKRPAKGRFSEFLLYAWKWVFHLPKGREPGSTFQLLRSLHQILPCSMWKIATQCKLATDVFLLSDRQKMWILLKCPWKHRKYCTMHALPVARSFKLLLGSQRSLLKLNRLRKRWPCFLNKVLCLPKLLYEERNLLDQESTQAWNC